MVILVPNKFIIILGLFFSFVGIANSSPRDDFPSCYPIIGQQPKETNSRELFVLIDQTVKLDDNLKRSVSEKIHRFLRSGDRINIVIFSAYIDERYTDSLLNGQIDFSLSDKNRFEMPKAKLQQFDVCLKKQRAYARKLIDEKLDVAFNGGSTSIPKTEILATLARLSRGLISQSKADEKVVLLVSDMFENSDTLTFFKNDNIQQVDVKRTIYLVEQSKFLGDFKGAQVYVIGAGFISQKKSNHHRSATLMQNIHQFWEVYFSRSNARLVGWGQPALLTEIF